MCGCGGLRGGLLDFLAERRSHNINLETERFYFRRLCITQFMSGHFSVIKKKQQKNHSRLEWYHGAIYDRGGLVAPYGTTNTECPAISPLPRFWFANDSLF